MLHSVPVQFHCVFVVTLYPLAIVYSALQAPQSGFLLVRGPPIMDVSISTQTSTFDQTYRVRLEPFSQLCSNSIDFAQQRLILNLCMLFA